MLQDYDEKNEEDGDIDNIMAVGVQAKFPQISS